MFEGFQITMGGENYNIKPLNFKILRQISPYIPQTSLDSNAETRIDAIARIIIAVMQHNYPEMSEDVILEKMYASEVVAAFSAISEELAPKKKTIPQEVMSQ